MFFNALSSIFRAPPEVPELGRSAPKLEQTPDTPYFLASKNAWFAISSDSPERVADAIGLVAQKPANWASGIKWSDWSSNRHFEQGWFPCFVTPATEGWVLVRGAWIGPATSLERKLKPLSKKFGTAHYFATFRMMSMYGWATANKGKLKRRLFFSEDEVILRDGPESVAEVELGLGEINAFNSRLAAVGTDALNEELRYVGESDVYALAAAWSLDVQSLGDGKMSEPGVGIAGILWDPAAASAAR